MYNMQVHILKNICEGYDDKDVYNWDETGLFFEALLDKIFTKKSIVKARYQKRNLIVFVDRFRLENVKRLCGIR